MIKTVDLVVKFLEENNIPVLIEEMKYFGHRLKIGAVRVYIWRDEPIVEIINMSDSMQEYKFNLKDPNSFDDLLAILKKLN